MANPVTCLSCKNAFTPTEASPEGPFLCPHCGALVAAAPTSPVRQAGASRPSPSNIKGARPKLMDRLPPNPVMSPGLVAGAGAFVLAYSVVMLIVLSATKKEPDIDEGPDLLAMAVRTPNLSTITPKPPPIADPKSKETTPKKEPADSKRAKDPAEPPPNPVVAKLTTPSPETKPKRKRKPKPKPKPIRTIANLGKLADSAGECKLIPDASGLTIFLPGKLYILSPELGTKNSPKALIGVEGEFVAQVKIAGEVMPGRTPVEKMPFAFHGAGLLLWKDKDNYLRLERAGAGASGFPHTHQILVEVCKDGKPGEPHYADWPAKPTILRMQRTKEGLTCSHSGDGKTWVEDKVLGPLFPGKVSVGISASSTSKKAFPARFEEFTLDERPAGTAEPQTPEPETTEPQTS